MAFGAAPEAVEAVPVASVAVPIEAVEDVPVAFGVAPEAVRPIPEAVEIAHTQLRQTADSTASAASGRTYAVVNLSSVCMHQRPDYESPLETQELMGTVVEVIGEQSYWRQTVSPQPYTAWCNELALTVMNGGELSDYKSAPKLLVTACCSRIFTLPSEQSLPLCDLVAGDILRYAGGNAGAGESVVSSASGVPGHRRRRHRAGSARSRAVEDAWTEVMIPSGAKGWVKSADVEDYAQWVAAAEDSADRIAATAERFLGVPYMWGGMTPKGFDCSGLVRISYMLNGVLLPRNASQMVFCGESVPVVEAGRRLDGESDGEYMKRDMTSRISALQPGDLLFFGTKGVAGRERRITHVGLYLGGGRMIHSSQLVRINSLIPGSEDYYENSARLIAACRIIGHEDEGSNGFRPVRMK